MGAVIAIISIIAQITFALLRMAIGGVVAIVKALSR